MYFEKLQELFPTISPTWYTHAVFSCNMIAIKDCGNLVVSENIESQVGNSESIKAEYVVCST